MSSYYDRKSDQFLQIDLVNVTKVTRIATQGQSDERRWIKTYTLDYSENGGTFISYNNGQVYYLWIMLPSNKLYYYMDEISGPYLLFSMTILLT